jgi:hypothetical protein
MHLYGQMPYRFSLLKRGALSSRWISKSRIAVNAFTEFVVALTVADNFKGRERFTSVENVVEPETQRC